MGWGCFGESRDVLWLDNVVRRGCYCEWMDWIEIDGVGGGRVVGDIEMGWCF